MADRQAGRQVGEGCVKKPIMLMLILPWEDSPRRFSFPSLAAAAAQGGEGDALKCNPSLFPSFRRIPGGMREDVRAVVSLTGRRSSTAHFHRWTQHGSNMMKHRKNLSELSHWEKEG